MDHANPLYSPPAPNVDIDANVIPLTSAWTALADATSDWDVEGLSARYRPSSPVWRYRKRITCLCSSRMRRWLRSVRMGRFSKWFHVWVSGLLGADACCCSVNDFLGHGYVKEKTCEMEDRNMRVRKKRAVTKEICLWTELSFLELDAGHLATLQLLTQRRMHILQNDTTPAYKGSTTIPNGTQTATDRFRSRLITAPSARFLLGLSMIRTALYVTTPLFCSYRINALILDRTYLTS